MREILFRGKRVDGNGWASGSLDLMYDGTPFITFWVSELIEPENNYSEMVCKTFEVHPETVGQFTGLFDKNGKKIFEGDVVISGFGIYDNPVPVFWDNELFMWSVPDYDYTDEMPPLHALYLYNSNVEIIGNIHESADNLPPH